MKRWDGEHYVQLRAFQNELYCIEIDFKIYIGGHWEKESHMARSSRKSFPVEQMMEYLGYEKLIEEMLEKYVAGIYVYDDGRVEVE